MADDYEFHWAGASRMIDLDTFHGRDEYIREQTRLLEHLNVARIELDDVIPLGDGAVVALFRFVVRAGDGTIDQQVLDHHVFRDGELVQQTMWFDREEGLRELGL
jgi:hypothetical protein